MMKTEEGGAFMKCQHCGINFDDSERECPMCGARAGSRGRLGEAQQRVRAQRAEPVQQSHAAYIKAKARPTGRKAKASAKPIRENKKRGRGKIAAIVIAAAVVINIVPLLTDLADNFAESVSTYRFDSEAGGWQEDLHYVPGETYPYDPDNYQPVYAALYDLTGGYAAGVLSDGSTIAISVEEGEMGDYTLTVQDGTGIYTENGYTWCSYNYPEEAVYWGNETDTHVMQSVADPENLQPLPSPPFIQAFTLSDGAVGGRFVLYDAQGRALPETLTGTPGGGGKRESDGFTNSACTVIVLMGVAVSAVRLRRIRRQEQAAQQEDAQQNGQGQSKR